MKRLLHLPLLILAFTGITNTLYSQTLEELYQIFDGRDTTIFFSGGISVSSYDYEFEGRNVQAILFQPASEDPLPSVIMIPGYDRTAIDYAGRGLFFASKGYACLAITQPGFGRSEGTPDWAGPATLRTLKEGYWKLSQEPFVNPDKICFFGYSRGALAAGLLATGGDLNIRATILCSGIYDIQDAYDNYKNSGAQGRIKASLLEETGMTPDAVAKRNIMGQVDRINHPLLILHGRMDVNAPPEQAEDLARELRRNGIRYQFRIYEGADHSLHETDYLDVCQRFLDKVN